jgi:2'-5' RNA ligase
MQRVFIAVDISEEVRAAATQYTETLRHEFPDVRVGWERPEKLHFTLKFLGNLDDARLGDLTAAVAAAAIAVEVMQLELAGTGAFPNPRNPRILWLGVYDPSSAISKLAEAVESECARVGFPRESRPFRPHLTIARVKEPHKARQLAEAHYGLGFGPIPFVVNELTIYESELRPTGSVYSKLAVFPLRKS